MLTESQFRDWLRQKYIGKSHDAIASELGLSAGFVGMVLSGSRKPSKAILSAMGMERIVFYRPKECGDLPDAIRVPLQELQADADYLIGRVAADGSCASMISENIKKKLAAIEAELLLVAPQS